MIGVDGPVYAARRKGLQADPQAAVGLVVMPEGELIKEDGAQEEALGGQYAAGGHAAQALEASSGCRVGASCHSLWGM